MRPPKKAWPNTSADRGVLLFAQLMSEMLNPTTFESFRVFSLDTIARLNEALSLIERVQANKIPRESLNPVIEELRWSLDKDPVVNLSAPREVESFVESAHLYDLVRLSAHIKLIKKLIESNYKTTLEKQLLDLVSKPRKRIKLRQAAGFYCSRLINAGYSKIYIADLVANTFFPASPASGTAPSSIVLLSNFFGRFDEREKHFRVYTKVSQEFGSYLDKLGFSVSPLTRIPQTAMNALISNGDRLDLPVSVTSDVRSFDSYGATLKVHETLTSVRALTYLAPEGMPCEWSGKMYVMAAESALGEIREQIPITFDKPSAHLKTAGRKLKGIRNYTEQILGNFDPASTERILSSVNTGALARTSPNVENQLISLWSAFEVLLSAPPPNTPRITHYSKLLLPCICLRHVRRQFVAVFEEMIISYRRRFIDILAKEERSVQNDPHTNFAAVLCLPDNEHLRKELCDLCTDNPLGLHRLWKLHRDYSSPDSALAAIAGHEKRVEWQTFRIYRARNQLVHAGDVPSYLDSLILNLAEYYRGAVATIVNRARREDAKSDIDQVVAEIGIEYNIFKRHFEKIKSETSFSRNELNRLVG